MKLWLSLLMFSTASMFADWDCLYCESDTHLPCQCGEWLPERPPLFRPFVADPRQVCFSAGWRTNDEVISRNVGDCSFGDTASIYRWYNIGIGPLCGDLEIDIEGAVWAVFDPLNESAALVNADYYAGIPVVYSTGPFALRLRFFHISSHIGDEFLIDNPNFDRRNPSAEYLDLFASYYWTDAVRLYGGVGWIVHQDTSFKTGRAYSEAGMELRFPFWSFYNPCQKLFGRPFFGMHFRANSDFNNHIDQTYVAGYEFGKTIGLCRRLRIYFEYHDGYSVEGQFACHTTDYISARISYGF